MGWWRAIRIAGLVGSALTVAGAPLRGALQHEATAAEGQTLHVFVNKSVVINSETRVVRMMTGNPAVIDTVATTPTQIVVTGKTPGVSSFIIWDSPDHSQILDVVVDLRRSSPSFGGWEAVVLSEENRKMIWVPVGFAHGFRFQGYK